MSAACTDFDPAAQMDERQDRDEERISRMDYSKTCPNCGDKGYAHFIEDRTHWHCFKCWNWWRE